MITKIGILQLLIGKSKLKIIKKVIIIIEKLITITWKIHNKLNDYLGIACDIEEVIKKI